MSPASSASRSSTWKLSLPYISTSSSSSSDRSRLKREDSSRASERAEDSAVSSPSPLSASPPPSSSSTMSTFAESFSMKKRLSDSITDRWSRRRPTMAQGNSSSGSISSSRGKEGVVQARGRASSSVTSPTSRSAPTRGPPVLNSSASMATMASNSSSNSSTRGALARVDSYSELVAKGFPQPPTGVGSSRRENPIGDSPTVPVFEPVRSQRIISEADLEEVDNEDDEEYRTALPDRELWEDLMGETEEAATSVAAEVGMQRVEGITRKISNSKRIIQPPSPEDSEDPFEDPRRASEDSTEYQEQLSTKDKGKLNVNNQRPTNDRQSTMSTAPSSAPTYDDLSSDEESTSSSLRSGGTKSMSENSARAGLPHSTTFSHTQSRMSRAANAPPPLELPTLDDRNLSATGTSGNAPPRPHSSGPSARSATASPLRPGHTPGGSSRAKSVLDVPAPSGSSRMSSLASPSAPNISERGSSASSATAVNSVARSDSNSSTNTSTAPYANNNNASASSSTPATAGSRYKYLTSRDRKTSMKQVATASTPPSNRSKGKHPPSLEPPLPDPAAAPKVSPAPASGMYWYKAPTHGMDHKPLRAHTCTLVGSNIYVFGGCDSRACFNELHVFDADSMSWSKPQVYGEMPPPLRAMTTTAVRNKLVIFGGGDGPTYYNDIYIFDTVTNRYTKPQLVGSQQPCRRRAHTACLYKNGIYVFGGGDGVRALNDVWRLDVSDLSKPSWKLISAPSSSVSSSRMGATSSSLTAVDAAKPTARGYHTANMVGSKLIIFGGSDGDDCFKDVWVFDVESNVWKCVDIKKSYSRLSHTATIIGSYLFVVGGHDGVEYSSEVLLLNLVTMQWDRRKVYGMPPSGRGYHGAVLYDSRLFIIGGFDGHSVFKDSYILELAVSSYYSQISHFSIIVSTN